MSRKMFCPSDTNFTSVSQRSPNVTPSNSIIVMPNLPKIHLCQTNWQEESANIFISKPASTSINKDLLKEIGGKEADSNLLMPSPLNKNSMSSEIEYFTWTPYLNKNLQIAVKGQTKNGFIHGRSIQKRLTNLELIDKCNNIQKLRGSLLNTDDLPTYIIEKFQNGFPLDWQAVTSIWVDYVRLHKPKEFRWPQPISDLNEDIHDNNSVDYESSFVSVQSYDTQNENTSIPIKSHLNNTYDLQEKSQVEILSNVLLKKRQHHTITKDCSTQVSSKRQKIAEYFDTIINTLHKLRDDILNLSDENETILAVNNNNKTHDTLLDIAVPECSKESSQIPIVEHKLVINDKSISSSPEYMGIPNKSKFLVNSTRSNVTRRKIRKKSRRNSENINSIKKVDENCSNISFVSKINKENDNAFASNFQSTPKKVVLESHDKTDLENKVSEKNVQSMYMYNTLTNINFEKVLNKCPVSSSKTAKNKNLIKISRQSKPQSDSGIAMKTVNVPNSGTSSEEERIFPFISSSSARRQIISDTKEKTHQNIDNAKENAELNTPLQVSKRGRLRCPPLNYWEGETLETIVKKTENKDQTYTKLGEIESEQKQTFRRKTVKNKTLENKLHPALHSEDTSIRQVNSINGRVKLFNKTVENDIEILIQQQNISLGTQFTEL